MSMATINQVAGANVNLHVINLCSSNFHDNSTSSSTLLSINIERALLNSIKSQLQYSHEISIVILLLFCPHIYSLPIVVGTLQSK